MIQTHLVQNSDLATKRSIVLVGNSDLLKRLVDLFLSYRWSVSYVASDNRRVQAHCNAASIKFGLLSLDSPGGVAVSFAQLAPPDCLVQVGEVHSNILKQMGADDVLKVSITMPEALPDTHTCDSQPAHKPGSLPIELTISSPQLVDKPLEILKRTVEPPVNVQPEAVAPLTSALLHGEVFDLVNHMLSTGILTRQLKLHLQQRDATLHTRDKPNPRNAAMHVADAPVTNARVEDAHSFNSVSAQILHCAAQTPDKIALTCRSSSFTYAQLEEHVVHLSDKLHALGVGKGSRVGVMLERSAALPVVLIAIMHAGAAYVPIDPDYPADRIKVILNDAMLTALIVSDNLPEPTAVDVPCLSVSNTCHVEVRIAPGVAVTSSDVARNRPCADDLAYVIFTSGSTGRPKGVMVEHRNVLNFFAGMDTAVPIGKRRVFLALSSVSFDISVLELLWTLTRGFTVVVQSRPSVRSHPDCVEKDSAPGLTNDATHNDELTLGLFFFGSDAAQGGSNQYTLLLDGAKFADEHHFSAVWTPERHFHRFGGSFPNPSVLGAAIAAVTKNIGIRAGSCVLPLHHPARITEEWSVVDNLSNGRVGVSFASGWQPDDFVLRSDAYHDRHQRLISDIDIVKQLWRGEKVAFEGPNGMVGVQTLPRPVQAELPCWLTAAGNPETFRAAGTSGANLLTHLLGQSLDDLKQKIAIYRKARQEAGHAGPGIVSLMVHTFVHEDAETARTLARQPMKDYLGTSANLVKNYASAFPVFQQTGNALDSNAAFQSLDESDLDALLEHAFERFFSSSALMGNVDDAVAFIQKVSQTGIDDIACLIDFGIEPSVVLQQLPLLAEVRDRVNVAGGNRHVAISATDKVATVKSNPAPVVPHSVHDLITQYNVSHVQCTPTFATLLAGDSDAHAALGSLDALLVGGEALPASLGRQLDKLVGGQLVSLYGPTETTIWSATQQTPCRIPTNIPTVPLGEPITLTQLYILNEAGEPVADGEIGELVIGGAGVARGYFNNADLTKQQFINNPFVTNPAVAPWQRRLYKTGDRVCRQEGHLLFLGRADDQLKIRGHRIEVGDVEHALLQLDAIHQTVVMAVENLQGQKNLIACIVSDIETDVQQIKQQLARLLPAYMIPTDICRMDSFPETPNGKIDRKALQRQYVETEAAQMTPNHVDINSSSSNSSNNNVTGTKTFESQQTLEAAISQVWQEVLNLPEVDIHRNFFDTGGTSLLVINILQKLRKHVDSRIKLVDLFRYPTVATLAGTLKNLTLPANNVDKATAPELTSKLAKTPQLSGTRTQQRAAARRRARRAR